jgi:hypothetical protein
MQPEGSLPCSQVPATGLCRDSDVQFTPSHPISLRFIPVSSFHLRSGCPTKILYVFLIFPMGVCTKRCGSPSVSSKLLKGTRHTVRWTSFGKLYLSNEENNYVGPCHHDMARPSI